MTFIYLAIIVGFIIADAIKNSFQEWLITSSKISLPGRHSGSIQYSGGFVIDHIWEGVTVVWEKFNVKIFLSQDKN